MKKMMLACVGLTVLGGCVLPPKDVTEEDLAAFDHAVASIGCTLESEAQYLPVELQTGLTREKLIEVAQYKIALEQAVALESGGVRSVSGTCAPKAPAAEA